MQVTQEHIKTFKAAFYNNTGDETDDPVEIALKALFADFMDASRMEVNVFGKMRGRFDEASAQVAQRSIEQTLISSFFSIPPERLGAAIEAFNEAHKPRCGRVGYAITSSSLRELTPSPQTDVMLPTARFWNGNPCDPGALAGSLERYAKIRPGGDRDLWAMREAAKWIRAVIAATEGSAE